MRRGAHDEVIIRAQALPIERGYELSPGEISVATEWLRINNPGEEIPLGQAKRKANAELMAQSEALRPETGGRPRKDENCVVSTVSHGSTNAAYLAVRAPGDRDQAFRLIATSHSD